MRKTWVKEMKKDWKQIRKSKTSNLMKSCKTTQIKKKAKKDKSKTIKKKMLSK